MDLLAAPWCLEPAAFVPRLRPGATKPQIGLLLGFIHGHEYGDCCIVCIDKCTLYVAVYNQVCEATSGESTIGLRQSKAHRNTGRVTVWS